MVIPSVLVELVQVNEPTVPINGRTRWARVDRPPQLPGVHRMTVSLRRMALFAGCLLAACGPAGCAHMGPPVLIPAPPSVPRELSKEPLPDYVIEPPDILQIDALRLVPKGLYKIEPHDLVVLRVTNTFPKEPLDGQYQVEADGTIDLGLTYGGRIRLADLSLDQARTALEQQLGKHIMGHKVEIAAQSSRAIQQVRGQHLVRPDGTIGLGVYGGVKVVGLTIADARAAIEQHLSRAFLRPEVSLDVAAFNSKLYYVILDGAGSGQQVVRLPVTGNETVLDAIAQVNGLLAVSNKREICLARPSPMDQAGDQVYPVDWEGLTTRGRTATNYQLLPGDRVYINSEQIIEFDTRLARIISPIERVLGVTLLGHATVQTLKRTDPILNNGNSGSGF
jgi:polysaccharide biosynthesis/export protein